MRAAEHAPRDPFRVRERRDGLAPNLIRLRPPDGNVRRMTLEERRELGLRDNTAPPVRCEPPPELLRLMRLRDERTEKMKMAERRERRLPFLLCRHRRKDAEARAGDDIIVKLAIDAPLDLVRKVLKYV